MKQTIQSIENRYDVLKKIADKKQDQNDSSMKDLKKKVRSLNGFDREKQELVHPERNEPLRLISQYYLHPPYTFGTHVNPKAQLAKKTDGCDSDFYKKIAFTNIENGELNIAVVAGLNYDTAYTAEKDNSPFGYYNEQCASFIQLHKFDGPLAESRFVRITAKVVLPSPLPLRSCHLRPGEGEPPLYGYVSGKAQVFLGTHNYVNGVQEFLTEYKDFLDQTRFEGPTDAFGSYNSEFEHSILVGLKKGVTDIRIQLGVILRAFCAHEFAPGATDGLPDQYAVVDFRASDDWSHPLIAETYGSPPPSAGGISIPQIHIEIFENPEFGNDPNDTH